MSQSLIEVFDEACAGARRVAAYWLPTGDDSQYYKALEDCRFRGMTEDQEWIMAAYAQGWKLGWADVWP